MTEPGSELEIGEKATVAWRPKQRLAGRLDITVTDLERTSFEETFSTWQLGPETEKRVPYFVRATVENAGTGDLGGYRVPLYGLDEANDLIEAATFDSVFEPCHPESLPARFVPGDRVKACLVILVPSQHQLIGATFRPTEKTDPISWTGPVVDYHPPKRRSADKQGQRGG